MLLLKPLLVMISKTDWPGQALLPTPWFEAARGALLCHELQDDWSCSHFACSAGLQQSMQ